jgi:hypothetical protein
MKDGTKWPPVDLGRWIGMANGFDEVAAAYALQVLVADA